MSRYATAFADAKRRGETLFMPYLTAGFPTAADTKPLIEALIAGGAGAVELGLPFSDPLADGPTIQRANTVALQHGANLDFALQTVRSLRAGGVDIPITFMGYLNPMLSYRWRESDGGHAIALLAAAAAEAGVDGFIIVDLPPEESNDIRDTLRGHGLDLIYLLAPTSTAARIEAVAKRAAGFIYLVSVTGVTGAREQLPTDLVDFVARVRARTDLPLALGFGISTREQVETLGELCEAAVIGSAVITCIEQAPPADRTASLQRYAEVITGRRRGDTER